MGVAHLIKHYYMFIFQSQSHTERKEQERNDLKLKYFEIEIHTGFMPSLRTLSYISNCNLVNSSWTITLYKILN